MLRDTPTRTVKPTGLLTYSLIAAWFGMVGTSFAALSRYKALPGRTDVGVETYTPSGGAETGKAARLVMFAHPECPCTRASLAELARIARTAGSKLSIEVVFMMPADAPASWRESDIVMSAMEVPNAHVRFDMDGTEAARFGAGTSGDVSLFAKDGRRLFHGGITASRGHEGDNAGARAILAALDADYATPKGTNVYGCDLDGLL
jgi:hypothetical protein